MNAQWRMQDARQALHDRKSQTKAAGPVSFGISNLVEFVKNQILLIGWNSAPGIPNLDAEAHAAPAANHHTPSVGIADRIGHEVAHDAFKQNGIRRNTQATGNKPQLDALALDLRHLVAADALQQRLDGNDPRPAFYDAGIKP